MICIIIYNVYDITAALQTMCPSGAEICTIIYKVRDITAALNSCLHR